MVWFSSEMKWKVLLVDLSPLGLNTTPRPSVIRITMQAGYACMQDMHMFCMQAWYACMQAMHMPILSCLYTGREWTFYLVGIYFYFCLILTVFSWIILNLLQLIINSRLQKRAEARKEAKAVAKVVSVRNTPRMLMIAQALRCRPLYSHYRICTYGWL